jgi:hypothetical protein
MDRNAGIVLTHEISPGPRSDLSHLLDTDRKMSLRERFYVYSKLTFLWQVKNVKKLASRAVGQFRISGKFEASHSQLLDGAIPSFVDSMNRIYEIMHYRNIINRFLYSLCKSRL